MKNKVKEIIKKEDESKLFAFLATFLSIIGFVIALIAKRDDKYVMFYAKQSLVIFIIAAIAGVIQTIISFMPFIGGIIKAALTVLIVILWILSWVYALTGEMRLIPIIGDFSEKIDL